MEYHEWLKKAQEAGPWFLVSGPGGHRQIRNGLGQCPLAAARGPNGQSFIRAHDAAVSLDIPQLAAGRIFDASDWDLSIWRPKLMAELGFSPAIIKKAEAEAKAYAEAYG